MSLEQQVREAVARGLRHPANENKVIDPDLAEAIVAEVVKSFTPVEHPADH